MAGTGPLPRGRAGNNYNFEDNSILHIERLAFVTKDVTSQNDWPYVQENMERAS
jgi:hypothetical protein